MKYESSLRAERLIASLLFLLLPACGKVGGYPSLNPRPIETKAANLLAEPETAPLAPAPATPAMRSRIEAALGNARNGEAEFDRALGATRSAVGAAGASGSESWIMAQLAISALERARAPVKVALADLDAVLRAALAGPPGEDLALVEGAIRNVESIDVRQNATMAELLKAVSR